MSFFLLGKDPDGRLTLLSETALATRQAAMAELSRITADPSFSSWDDEVVVMDLGAGTPVLLVRPASGESVSGDASVVEADEAAEEVADEAAVAAAAEDAEETVERSETEATAPDSPDEEQPAPEDEAVAEGEAEIEDSELSEDAGVVEAPAPDAEPAPQEDEEEVSLKEALQRTAEQMESEGISAPDSIGPAEEGAAEPAPDAEESVADATPTEAGDEVADATDEAGESADEAQAWPWDTAAAAEQSADAEPAPFVLDALEEPGTDDGGLVRAPGDDETMSSARPVILGAYGEVDGAVDPATATETTAVDEPVALADEAPADSAESAAADAEMSDFILDLEPVPSGYELSPSAQTQMSCLDCIYERTCPHKDVGPPDCGSFQWK